MQQEQIQPDYNYIMSQDSPEPKKRSFKFPIIVGIVLLVILVVGVVALQLLNGSSDISGRAITQDEAKEFNRNYFANITDGQTEKAYANLSDAVQSNTKKDAYEAYIVKQLPKAVNFSQCEFTDFSYAAGTAKYKHRCPTKNNKFTLTFAMSVVRQANGTIRITESQIEATERAS